MRYPGLFKAYPDRQGKDWLRRVDHDDRQAFSRIGREEMFHGYMGGKARAATGKRDERGRFVKGGQSGNCHKRA